MWAENARTTDFPGRDDVAGRYPSMGCISEGHSRCQTTARSAAVAEESGSVGSEASGASGASGDAAAAVAAARLELAAEKEEEDRRAAPEAAVPLRRLRVKSRRRTRHGSEG